MTVQAGESRSGLFLISIFALAALGVLLSLGTWQLQRLAWKEDLLETIDARAKAAPVPLTQALALDNKDYVRVSVAGSYHASDVQRMYHVQDGVLGWKVLAPFKATNGKVYWADRGFVRDQEETPLKPPAGEVQLAAALRTTYLPQGLFTPDNVPGKRQWYWFDQTALDAAAGVKSQPGLVLQLDASDHAGQWPLAKPAVPKLSNKHFGYAMTWFGLAITLLCVYIAYILQHRRKTSSS